MPKMNPEHYSHNGPGGKKIARETDRCLPVEKVGGKDSAGMTGTKYTGAHTKSHSGGFAKVVGQKKGGKG